MRLSKTLASAMAAALLLAGASLANTEGPFLGVAWIETGSTSTSDDGVSNYEMSAKDLKQRLDKGEKIVILDAREGLNGQIIKGAIHLPEDKLEEWAKTADKATVIVTYCTCPHDEAAESEVHKLRQMGFPKTFSLKGGLDAARAAGIEIVAPKE
ncbi:MAG TPA: rhodanese-like domain-containing protein [Blastocatellia bacterium]|nr:rhodanese-like domain-containing protein [Blastocatellia bacterium]